MSNGVLPYLGPSLLPWLWDSLIWSRISLSSLCIAPALKVTKYQCTGQTTMGSEVDLLGSFIFARESKGNLIAAVSQHDNQRLAAQQSRLVWAAAWRTQRDWNEPLTSRNSALSASCKTGPTINPPWATSSFWDRVYHSIRIVSTDTWAVKKVDDADEPCWEPPYPACALWSEAG